LNCPAACPPRSTPSSGTTRRLSLLLVHDDDVYLPFKSCDSWFLLQGSLPLVFPVSFQRLDVWLSGLTDGRSRLRRFYKCDSLPSADQGLRWMLRERVTMTLRHKFCSQDPTLSSFAIVVDFALFLGLLCDTRPLQYPPTMMRTQAHRNRPEAAADHVFEGSTVPTNKFLSVWICSVCFLHGSHDDTTLLRPHHLRRYKFISTVPLRGIFKGEVTITSS